MFGDSDDEDTSNSEPEQDQEDLSGDDDMSSDERARKTAATGLFRDLPSDCEQPIAMGEGLFD